MVKRQQAEILDKARPTLERGRELMKRKRKKRRKKKLPKVSSFRAVRPWKSGHSFIRALRLWQSCSVGVASTATVNSNSGGGSTERTAHSTKQEFSEIPSCPAFARHLLCFLFVLVHSMSWNASASSTDQQWTQVREKRQHRRAKQGGVDLQEVRSGLLLELTRAAPRETAQRRSRRDETKRHGMDNRRQQQVREQKRLDRKHTSQRNRHNRNKRAKRCNRRETVGCRRPSCPVWRRE